MISEIEIRLWDQIVGYAAYKNSRLVYFEYEKNFPIAYDLAPMMMPRARKQVWSFDLNESTYYGLPGLLADSLPDKYGNQMINAWFASQGLALTEISALDRLCYLGTRAMGALEFFPNHNEVNPDLKIELAKLIDFSQKILQERLDFKASTNKDFAIILKIGSSAGGARAKAVIAFNPKTKEIHSGQSQLSKGFEHWLIKLDGVDDKALGKPLGYTNIEYAYYLMAQDCAIHMSQSRLLEENGRMHFLTKRFDRTDQGDKLHMQTLCALTHLDYNQPRLASYELLFRVANLLALNVDAREQLFRRMVFNVIARNQDDHTKNFSFLMNKDAKWFLAPAYDLTFACDPNNYWLQEHQLLVNGKSKDIKREDFLVYANKFHIKAANEIIDQIIEICSQFKSYAKKAGVSKDKAEMIEQRISKNP